MNILEIRDAFEDSNYYFAGYKVIKALNKGIIYDVVTLDDPLRFIENMKKADCSKKDVLILSGSYLTYLITTTAPCYSVKLFDVIDLYVLDSKRNIKGVYA